MNEFRINNNTSKKGISAVITIVLLLLIVVVITGFTFVFFQTFTEESTTATTQQIEQQKKTYASGTFRIDAADKNRIWIRNDGTQPLAGLAFYANGAAMNYTASGSVSPGQTGQFILNATQFPDDDTITILVTSAVLQHQEVVTTGNLAGNGF